MRKHISTRSFSICLLLSILTAPCAARADADPWHGWRVGVGRAVITPSEPMALGGYYTRTGPYTSIDTPLFLKAMAFEDADGRRGVIITADLLGFAAAQTEALYAGIAATPGLGLAREQVLFNASHTHAAPLISLEPRAKLDDEGRRKVLAYFARLGDQTVAVVEEAIADLAPARLSWATGLVDFVISRRLPTPEGVVLRANRKGPADRGVPVLKIESPEGELRAVLFGAACHNATLMGDNYAINGDYAVHAQMAIEANHPGASAHFLLGCGGDTAPDPRGGNDMALRHGEELSGEVERLIGGPMHSINGALSTLLAHVDLPLEPLPREKAKALAAGKTEHNLVGQLAVAAYEAGERPPTEYNAPVALWRFGGDLTLVGLPGEAVSDYVDLVGRSISPSRLWVAGYCNDFFGYLPSARILAEGGYEAKGLLRGGMGIFKPEVERAIVDTVRELAIKAGREDKSDAR